MKTATVRDLRYDFPKLEASLASGGKFLMRARKQGRSD